MKIKSITKVELDEPKQYYDVINANPYNNFLIKTKEGAVVSHNCFFDEISFIRNKDIDKQKTLALDMINTAIGGMKTRFIKNGRNASLLVLASSKRSDSSFLESYLRKKIESEGENLFVVDKAVWEVQPKGTYSEEKFPVAVGNKFLLSQIVKDPNNLEEYIKKGYKIIYPPVDFLPDFMDDIDRALCDFAGIASTELSKYISGEVWADTVDDTLHNPFMQEVLEIGNGKDDARKYQEFFDMSKVDRRMMSHPLYVHMDMSVSGDKTGIAGVWIRSKATSQAGREASNELTFQLAFAVSIKAPKGRQISFDKNRRFIYWLKDMGFNVKGVSTDSFESADTGQALQAHGYNYKQISVDRTERVGTNSICKPYQYFRSCIYENRLVTFYDELLSEEVIDLERNINTGRVDHPEGGCITGDTQISLCDGRELSILELIDEFNQGKQNYVYSVNIETLNIESDLIVNAFKTKTNAKLVEVILSNHNAIKCTPDHRFMLTDGTYCEAKDLKKGSSLKSKEYYIEVFSVKFVKETQDVYDITTEHNHNFALTAGVFIHNSKDISDAVCGAIYNASQNAEQFAYDFGEEDIEDVVNINNSTSGENQKKQIAEDFEQQLQELFNPTSIKQLQEQRQKEQEDEDSDNYPSSPMAMDGMLIW